MKELKMLTPDEVSELLGVPYATLARWRLNGVGPKWYRLGRHVRYRPDEVAAWVETQIAAPRAYRDRAN